MPEKKSSAVVVPIICASRWVWGSIAPGKMRRPEQSRVFMRKREFGSFFAFRVFSSLEPDEEKSDDSHEEIEEEEEEEEGEEEEEEGSISSPTAAIFPSRMSTSARKEASPLTTVPP